MEVEATNPEPEIVETQEPEAVVESQDDDDSQPGEETQAEEEFEEVEEEGEKYALPKKLKAKFDEYKTGHMMQRDYTQKTMTLANERKEFEARQQAFADDTKAEVEIYAIDQQLEQFKNLNWDELFQSDPVQAMMYQRQETALRDTRNQRANELTQRRNENALKKQQDTAKQIQEGQAVLAKEIKGWGQDYAQKLTKFGKESYGFSDEFMGQILDPKMVLALNDAYLYRQLKKQSAQKPQPEAKPVAKITGGKTKTVPTEFHTGMSDEQYDAWRNRQKRNSK